MTAEQFITTVNRVSYKSGWKFRAHETTERIVEISVLAKVQSAYPPYHEIQVGFKPGFFPESCVSEQDVLRCVKKVLFEAEDHEFAEWFRVDGRRPYDPHKKGRT